ncbi:hypothetical protein ADIARSV_1425 [Arcticibacter svalbardensis MN12-7]|uniref:DinB family protein n=1 Tax=Arcticibacter svalbardensis MN12-7 TaxID=1150600 RepID=R9H2I1_9SPHI|nr:DinB family protein [Arcticibacter svalbardensis]EOR95424.1 hypothetical protein ADIARSV_1425 [Arcticibacter svalbardensis MN12-7]
MSTVTNFLEELKQESETTCKMLKIIPEDKYEWQPHVKSMTIKQLSSHIADLTNWIPLAFDTDELDFAVVPYSPATWNNNEELLDLFEHSFAEAKAKLENAKDEDLTPEWILRNGDQILGNLTKGGLIRIALSQTIHHRAQLGVYLRLLDIPIPGSYGPSADDQSF